MRYSLRTLTFALILLSAALGVWVSWPRWTVRALVDAIRAKDTTALETLIEGDDQGLGELVRSRDTENAAVHLEPRSLSDLVYGRQPFLISGYEGAHRGYAIRGKIEELDYTFISGGLEYRR